MIHSLQDLDVVQIEASFEHSIFLIWDHETGMHSVWVCGDSDCGALGTGEHEEDLQQHSFVRVAIIGGRNEPLIKGGTYNSWVVLEESNRNKLWTLEQIKTDPEL